MKRKPWADQYTAQARTEGYLARSVFKLQEILQRSLPIAKGSRILDLGAAPGSWSQYFLQRVGEKGHVVAVDLHALRIHPMPPQLTYIQGDMNDAHVLESCAAFAPYHIVASDAAPQTSGIALVDATASLQLAETAAEISQRYLQRSGHLLIKIFEGSHTQTFVQHLRKNFQTLKIIKPRASRTASCEIYLLAHKILSKA